MKSILVLRGGALGDFIVTLPAIAALRARWPGARIELVGNATAAQLAVGRRLLDRAHSQHEARWSALFGDAPLPAALAAWLGEFDLVINYWPDPAGELRARFPLRPGQTFLSADAMPALSPAAAHYCAPLRALGIEVRAYFHPLEAGRVILNPPPRDLRTPGERRVKEGAPSPICIHPGSGSPRKNWPAENWRALIARLPAPVSLILGEAEAEVWGRADLPGVERVVAAPLEELVARFAACRLFLGHDSGVSHLAAASGARCVLLFGPTEAARWAPPAPSVRVLQRGPELHSLPLEEVARAVEAALADRT